jgi:hypothetical protein
VGEGGLPCRALHPSGLSGGEKGVREVERGRMHLNLLETLFINTEAQTFSPWRFWIQIPEDSGSKILNLEKLPQIVHLISYFQGQIHGLPSLSSDSTKAAKKGKSPSRSTIICPEERGGTSYSLGIYLCV